MQQIVRVLHHLSQVILSYTCTLPGLECVFIGFLIVSDWYADFVIVLFVKRILFNERIQKGELKNCRGYNCVYD